MSRDDLLQFNVILVPSKIIFDWYQHRFFWELSMDVMIPFEWNQWVLSSPEIAFSSIIESPFMEPFLCMNITTIPLNINTNIRISSRFFYPLKVVPRKSVQFPKSKFKYRTYSFQPSKLQPEYLESTSFIRCSRHFYSSVFFQSRQIRSWLRS